MNIYLYFIHKCNVFIWHLNFIHCVWTMWHVYCEGEKGDNWTRMEAIHPRGGFESGILYGKIKVSTNILIAESAASYEKPPWNWPAIGQVQDRFFPYKFHQFTILWLYSRVPFAWLSMVVMQVRTGGIFLVIG